MGEVRFVEIEDDSKQMAFDTLLKGTHPILRDVCIPSVIHGWKNV